MTADGEYSGFIERLYVCSGDDPSKVLEQCFKQAKNDERIEIKHEPTDKDVAVIVKMDNSAVVVPESLWTSVLALPTGKDASDSIRRGQMAEASSAWMVPIAAIGIMMMGH
jgi:hypothetical protein